MQTAPEVGRWIVYYRRRGRRARDAKGRNVSVSGTFTAATRQAALRACRTSAQGPGSRGRCVSTLEAVRWNEAPVYLQQLAHQVDLEREEVRRAVELAESVPEALR